MFGATADDLVCVNRVEKFYFNKVLCLTTLFMQLDELRNANNDAFKITTKQPPTQTKRHKLPRYNQKFDDDVKRNSYVITESTGDNANVMIDQQRFSALILHPFPLESSVKIEIYATGVLNVAGSPSNEYFERIKSYINNDLNPILNRSLIDDL
jgi:hypothetical protein